MQENFNMEELMDLLFTRQFRKLKDILTEMNEVDIATLSRNWIQRRRW